MHLRDRGEVDESANDSYLFEEHVGQLLWTAAALLHFVVVVVAAAAVAAAAAALGSGAHCFLAVVARD